jgi:hypothetical protein
LQYLWPGTLVNSLKVELPWVETIYDTLCGWVHFFESHIFTAVSEGQGDGAIEIVIGGFRKKVKTELFQQVIESTMLIHRATIEIIKTYFALPRGV